MATKMFVSIIFVIVLCESSVESTLWTQMIDKSHDWSIDYSQQLKQQFLSITKSRNISFGCNASIWQTLDRMQDLEVWAVQMFNSWGSFPPTGALIGTITDFGSYDQCLAIEDNPIIDRPQFCMIDLKPPIPKPMPVHHNIHHRIDVLPKDLSNNKSIENVFKSYSEFASFFYWITLRTGICTPSTCSKTDISQLAEGFAEKYGLELTQSRCETKPSETTFTSIQIIAISFICSVMIISVTATLWERFAPKKQNCCESPLLIDVFSLKQNLKCLFAKTSSEVFHCIHGFRVLNIVWIVFCHTIEWTNYQLFSRTFRVKDLFSRIDSQLTLNGEYAVENFFFIGGMLTSFITFQYTRGKLSRFSAVGFLVSRFMRLTPQIMIFILITFLIPLGGWASGPIWNETINPIIENCSKNWWWNILYIQNLFKEKDECAIHLWYLACDMQYHWLSLFLVIPLLYKQKLGVIVTCFSIMAFYLSTFIISYSYDLPPGLINTGRDQHWRDYYIDFFIIKPWSHPTVFFIGFLFGIVVYNQKFKKLSKSSKYVVFTFIITGYIICLMDTYPWNAGEPHNRLLSAFIFSTTRVLWSVSTAALIWMCISGNGGKVNRFLSSKFFIPLSRLTYSVYLTHVWIIWIFVGTRRERIDTNWTEFVFIFTHNLIISYLIGFLFTILFELPFLRLQKRIFNKFVRVVEDNNTFPELRVALNNNNNNNNIPNDSVDLESHRK